MKSLLILLVITTIITSTLSFSSENNYFGPEFSVLQKVYDDCKDTNDFTGCLKHKAITAITKAIDQDTIKISNGLILEKQNTTESSSKSDSSFIEGLTDARTLNSLSTIDRNLLKKIDKFFRSHVLKFDMITSVGNEGRGGGGGGGGGDDKKKDNGIKYVVAALLTAMGIAGPLGLKALAAIAGKALVISKVALTIAGIIALKKLFSHDHHEETSFQVHAGDHNRRNSYLVRPVSPSQPANNMDPYRYYYEHAQH